MIEKVSIRNFKSLRDVSVGLERFTVFVGPNASGKTSVLQALDLLCWAFRNPQSHNDSVAQAVSRGATEPIELIAESGGRRFRYSVAGSDSAREVAADHDSDEWLPWQSTVGGKTSPPPRSVLLRLEPAKLALANVASPDPMVMGADGMGMHSVLACMALNDPDAFEALRADLQRIIPTIKRLRYTKTRPGEIPSLLFDTLGGDAVPATQVSEGTLLVLGLLTVLHGSDRPSLVLLDDLDRALHPVAQKNLVTLLRGLLETNPDLQIVATTHSPYLLDCMEPNEVRMTYLQDGSTLCAPLEEHPKFETWKEEMAPGEMWSLFGEQWLAKKKEAVA
jgi:predicted ATPase